MNEREANRRIAGWFQSRGWKVFPFQRDVWDAHAAGESGLLHCSTGAGKTYAVWFAALRQALLSGEASGLQVLWITPLRALAADTEAALSAPLANLGVDWQVAGRTGDTSSHQRKKMNARPPQAMVTTPESLSVLLSQPGFLPHFGGLKMIVVDEWHELLGTKRGVLVELALARLRTLAPIATRWGLSATIGNTTEAAEALGGFVSKESPRPMRIVRGGMTKTVQIETLLPPINTEYPWGGHLGLNLLPGVVDLLQSNPTSIVFTNTRSQAELWYQAILQAMPQWKDMVGLHHGSLSREVRENAEQGLSSGRLRVVVATSSLDLGVDFSPVDCVVQVGSPKGVARLMQRAGRSGHRPGAISRIVCVPANTLELLEFAAARDLAERGLVEARTPLRVPMDVLCQHIVSTGAAGPFSPSVLLDEVRGTHAFHTLTDGEWDWALDFAARGGAALRAYPEFARLREENGDFEIADDAMARRHRLTIGTIVSDSSVNVRFQNGASLGNVEESFLAKMRPGARFLFAGRCLELIRVRDLRATVRAAKGRPSSVPRWMGGKMPLSSQLSSGVRDRLTRFAVGESPDTPEMIRLQPVLEIQQAMSCIPTRDDLLIERLRSREGHHIFIYPFEGRLVHEGLAALFAYRLGKVQPLTFSLAVNDYGMELLSAVPAPLDEAIKGGLFSDEHLLNDILGSLHSAEMAKRRFREIARVAGLIQEGVGKHRKSSRALTISSSLLFDVFSRYDPTNHLLAQATREVLESQLEKTRLFATLSALRGRRLVIRNPDSVTPLAFPLFVERLREQLSSEQLTSRVLRMEAEMQSRRRS